MEPPRTLTGHYLTRSEAARQSGMHPRELLGRDDVLALSGQCAVEEVYPAFSFSDHGIDREVGRVVAHLRTTMDAWDATAWLTAPRWELGDATPLDRITRSGADDVIGIL